MEDPFLKFISTLSDKIQVEKEHKNLMEDLEKSPSDKEPSLEDALNVLRDKILEQKAKIQKPILEIVQTENEEKNEKKEEKIDSKEEKSEEDLFDDFVGKLKNIINKKPEESLEPEKTQDIVVKSEPIQEPVKELPVVKADVKEPKEEKNVKVKDKEIQKQTEKPKDQKREKKDKEVNPQDYVKLLDQLGSSIAKEENPGTTANVKKLLEEFTEKYLKKLIVMQEYAGGGGSVAKQYAHGGTMDGSLNVNGQILSGGVDISQLFGSGGGDPNVNTVVYSNSAKWDNTTSTVQSYSATWSTGIQTISFNDKNAKLSISSGNTVSLSSLSSFSVDLGEVPVVSGKWNSNFTTTNYFSAFWNAAVDELFNFYVTQVDPGSAFTSEDGNYYIIANSKLDNNTLWDSSFTQVFLLSTIWSSVYMTVQANSARWESVYTAFNELSSKYESSYTTTNSNSAKWNSVYNTFNSLSASYAAETLAIAYAIAL